MHHVAVMAAHWWHLQHMGRNQTHQSEHTSPSQSHLTFTQSRSRATWRVFYFSSEGWRGWWCCSWRRRFWADWVRVRTGNRSASAPQVRDSGRDLTSCAFQMTILADVDGFVQLWIIIRVWICSVIVVDVLRADQCLLDAAVILTWFKCAACVCVRRRTGLGPDLFFTVYGPDRLWIERHLTAFWQHNFCICILTDWRICVGIFSASDSRTHEDRCLCILLMSRWACAWEKMSYLAHSFRTKPHTPSYVPVLI